MGGVCGGGQVNAGTVLDRVISQASNKDDCLLYRLANYKNGGELIDAYNTGGQAEVEKLIREQFQVLMYNDGKGSLINRSEYLRWKFRDTQQVRIPIEASLSAHDPLAKWHDHEACWQMQYRGSLGETLLHVLIICDTKLHTRLARTLLKCFPKLAIDVVEGEEYLGASALHLAIAYFNNELVQELVEAGANLSQRAIGSFFLPRDQQGPRPVKHTDYEGLAYLGEFPLSWAACCGNESIYNLLLESGANPDSKDSFGNMILHMVVVCDKLEMFGYAMRHPKLPATDGILNTAGLTPLTLACKLGRARVFMEMLELSAKEFWRYSNITCSAYPLNALDTIQPDGKTNWNSALFIILNGTKEEHLDMLDGGIIQRLLEEKWKTFAQLQFLKRLIILVTHLVCLSGAIYTRPSGKKANILGGNDWDDYVRYFFEASTIIGVLCYIIVQQGGEIRNQGFLSFIKQQDPAKMIFLISNILILCCIPPRLMGDRLTEDVILVFAVPGSWFLLMFFAGAIRLTGPFVTMVYSMIMGDMFTFGIIYTVVLFGFSQSFYFLYKGFPGVKNTLYSSYPTTWMALFQITLGDYNKGKFGMSTKKKWPSAQLPYTQFIGGQGINKRFHKYADLAHTSYPALCKTVFLIFMVLVPILMLNMLIAMMGNTYAHVIEQSEKEWMKQWAKIVVSLERAVNQQDAMQYLQEYSIRLGPSPDDPNIEQRGVLVIKSKSKTRAKQRKGAVANWKRVGKVTINELRKRNMTGEQLRRLMWDRASISTPIKVPISTDIAHALLEAQADQSTQNQIPNFGDALFGALESMVFSDIDNMTSSGAGQHNRLSLEQMIGDPFRDLVLSEELNAEEEQLMNLAVAAAQSIAMAVDGMVYSQAMFEQAFAMELSDTDCLADGLMLGHGSRVRKVKSAQARQKAARPPLGWPASNQSSMDNDPPPPYSSLPPPPFSALPPRHHRLRPKTARQNRVTPVVEISDRPKTSDVKLGGSDHEGSVSGGSHSGNGSGSSRVETNPQLLEPWSTRNIANMNTIMAWEPSDEDNM